MFKYRKPYKELSFHNSLQLGKVQKGKSMKRDELKIKLKFYFEHKISIHIDTFDNKFYNGLIIELHENFFVLFDKISGDTPISYTEIRNLEKYKGRKE